MMSESKVKKKSKTKFPNGSGDKGINIEEVVACLSQNIQHFSGPLPSPEILKEYDKILPNAAERIFQMAEKSQNHYEETEKKLVDLEIKKVVKGQILAFFIAITGIIGAIICAAWDQVTIGSIIGGATLISLVPHFIPGKRRKKEEGDHPQDSASGLQEAGKKDSREL